MSTEATHSRHAKAVDAVPDLEFLLAVLRHAWTKMNDAEKAALLRKLQAYEAMLTGVAQFFTLLEAMAEKPIKH